MTTMTTGQRIAGLRKEQGLSQEALGAELGVSRQAIYKWESDTALPEIEKLVALARRFGVSVGWLLGVEEAETPPCAAGEPAAGVSSAASLMREIVLGCGLPILLPLAFGLNGVLYSMPVSDLVTFIVVAILIVRTMRELSEK